MAASADHAVAYTIAPIFKHIIDCVQLYFTNGFWLVGVTFIFDGTPQIIVLWYQIAVLRWPNDISSVADNAIFKNREQNIECSFGCVAQILPISCSSIFVNKKFVQHGPITIAIDCKGFPTVIFE